MKKPEQKPKPKKRTVAVKDLTAKDAAKVKGGAYEFYNTALTHEVKGAPAALNVNVTTQKYSQ